MALACILFAGFAGCKKDDGGTNTGGEDLSYLIKTYHRYEDATGQIITQTWTYDGHKETSWKHYIDGLLYSERKNYSYNGLNASYDLYSYRNGDINDVTVQHYECEYLDDTYLRIKHQKSYYPDSQNNNIHETYYWYDGKKKISSKSYTNGVLTQENVDYRYDGLHCSYKVMYYSSSGTVSHWRSFFIKYLDDTYLRVKSQMYSDETYSDGQTIVFKTRYWYYDYDGKKPIGFHSYDNGELSGVSRDFQYDGLNCFYFVDDYQGGEVVSTRIREVEYLE